MDSQIAETIRALFNILGVAPDTLVTYKHREPVLRDKEYDGGKREYYLGHVLRAVGIIITDRILAEEGRAQLQEQGFKLDVIIEVAVESFNEMGPMFDFGQLQAYVRKWKAAGYVDLSPEPWELIPTC